MKKGLLQRLFTILMANLLKSYWQISEDLVRIHCARGYLQSVRIARRVFLVGILAHVLLLLLAVGAIILHLGFFLWMPWSLATRGLVLMGLGACYLLLGVIVMLVLCSERKWMKASGAENLIAKAVKR